MNDPDPAPRWLHWTLPRWAWVLAVLWLAAIGAWVPGVVIAGQQPQANWKLIPDTLALLGALAVLVTIGWGLTLALLHQWRWVLISAPAGTAVLLGWYLLIMAAIGDPNALITAAVGLLVLAVPILALVSLFLAVGGGLGSAYLRLRHPGMHP